MPFRFKVTPAVLAFCFAAASLGQTAPEANSPAPAATTPLPSSLLRPALSDVQGTTAALDISKWRASRGVRQATQQDVNSIQHDLGSTLPSLVAQADAAPASVPPSFAVYRNLDALYDVLLRVSQTANLAAPSREAAAVAASLRKLEAARSELGDSILNASQRHEDQIVSLEAAIRTARVAPAAHEKETIVDDGPVKHHAKETRRRAIHKKPVQKKAAPKTTSSGHPG
ncbi:MAG: hypothetical protein WAM66_05315 [Acidobacteriaceae bacterium]